MDTQARGFRPIWIVIPITSALIVALVLAVIAVTVDDEAQPPMSAQAASVVEPGFSSPSQ